MTRLRNGALLKAGLYLSSAVHLSHIVRQWPLPVVWRAYRGSKGHIGHPQTIALLKHVRQLLPSDCTVELMADAGFESVDLLAWLSRQHWHFVIRLSGRTKVT